MVLGLAIAVGVLAVLFVVMIAMHILLKKKHAIDLLRYSKIVDLEEEARKMKKAMDDEEKSSRNAIDKEVKDKRTEIDSEVNEKRQAIDKEVKDKDADIQRREKIARELIASQEQELTDLKKSYNEKRQLLLELSAKLAEVSDSVDMIDYGIYKPRFDYHDSKAFQEAISYNKERQKSLIRQDAACDFNTSWEVNGSKSEGKKMIKRYVKLLVRAFNSECDAAIGKIKTGNVEQLKKRIESAFDALNKFGQSMNISITYDYLNLRLEELLLCHEKELKIQDEKEILREERELQREEEKAQREYEKAIRDEQKAEKDFQKAMERARKELEKANAEEKSRIEAKIADLELQVEEARALSERAKSQAQLTRSGHVYVISNIGAFGENVYKIGLTRRLEPEDRVNELGSASVPFKFDIHALIYSDDAPALETSLHNEFSAHRINMVNNRKEFFKINLSDIEGKVKSLGFDASFTEYALAPEYRSTLSILNAKDKEKSIADAVEHKVEELFPEMA